MKRFNLIAVILTIAWIASMGALVTKHYGSLETPPPRETLPAWLFEESWTGVYQGGNKIGYTVSKLEPLDEGYRATGSYFMNVTAMGVNREIESDIEALLDDGFRLRSFTFTLDSDVSITVEGAVEGKEMVMKLDMNGVKTEKKIHLTEAPYLSPDFLIAVVDLSPGKKLSVPVIAPGSLASGYMELEVTGEEEITVMGLKQNTYRIDGDFMGADFTLWVDEEGQVIKQEAMSFTYIKEGAEEAKVLGTASLDLIADVAIPVDKYIPEDVGYLKIRIEGVDVNKYELDGGVQTLLEGGVVEIKIPSRIKFTDPGGEDLDEYLKESLLIESDDPSIVSLAEEIVGEEDDPIHRARLLSEWVHANIAKVPTMTIPSALEVLRTRRGDCNEHATLYTALARASGVPARLAIGVVHRYGHFYYHAWVEVYLGEWIPVDPALGQFPADAAHLRLLTGSFEKQIKLVSAVGKLKIRVLEYKL